MKMRDLGIFDFVNAWFLLMIFIFTISVLCSIDKIVKDLTVIKTVLVMKNIMPAELQKTE